MSLSYCFRPFAETLRLLVEAPRVGRVLVTLKGDGDTLKRLLRVHGQNRVQDAVSDFFRRSPEALRPGPLLEDRLCLHIARVLGYERLDALYADVQMPPRPSVRRRAA